MTRPLTWLMGIGVSFLGMQLAHGGDAPARPERPNIVMVVIDSVRADHLSCYGYPKPTTPFIDSLAEQGVRYDLYFSSSSWTAPSVMSLFTGLSSIRHRRNNGAEQPPEGIPTLAGVLREAGYRTLAVTCNFVAGSKYGYARGFDVFDDYTIPLELEGILDALPGDQPGDVHVGIAPAVDERLVTAALRIMRQVPEDQPYFLFIQLFDPHWDYIPEKEYADLFVDPEYKGNVTGRYIGIPEGSQFKNDADLQHFINLYNGEIRHSDDAIKRLVTTLRQRGQLRDDDVLAILSDHGEEFMEHGVLSHGKNLYEEAIRVPLVVVAPSWLPAGVTTRALAGHVDWLPTAAALAGVPAPEGLPGVDILALENGRFAPPEREGVFLHVMLNEAKARPMVAFRTAEAKVVRYLDADDEAVVFDLKADPKEQHPLPIGDNPIYQRWLKQLDAWYASEKKLAGLDE